MAPTRVLLHATHITVNRRHWRVYFKYTIGDVCSSLDLVWIDPWYNEHHRSFFIYATLECRSNVLQKTLHWSLASRRKLSPSRQYNADPMKTNCCNGYMCPPHWEYCGTSGEHCRPSDGVCCTYAGFASCILAGKMLIILIEQVEYTV
jgi:hypothetical protein